MFNEEWLLRIWAQFFITNTEIPLELEELENYSWIDIINLVLEFEQVMKYNAIEQTIV